VELPRSDGNLAESLAEEIFNYGQKVNSGMIEEINCNNCIFVFIVNCEVSSSHK